MSLSFYWHECLLNWPLGSLFMCLVHFTPFWVQQITFLQLYAHISPLVFLCAFVHFTPFGFNKSLFFIYMPIYQQWLSYHSLFIHDSINIWLFQITFDLYFSHKTWVYDSNLGHLMLHSRSKPVLGFPSLAFLWWHGLIAQLHIQGIGHS
jgi:hypothetical protein